MCERFHRTMQDEFYAIAFRKKIYKSIEEMQLDVDKWITFYNEPVAAGIVMVKHPCRHGWIVRIGKRKKY